MFLNPLYWCPRAEFQKSRRGAKFRLAARRGAAVSGCEVVLRSGPIHVRETPPKITPVETVRFPKFQSCFPVASVLHRDAGSPFWFESHAPPVLEVCVLLARPARGCTSGHVETHSRSPGCEREAQRFEKHAFQLRKVAFCCKNDGKIRRKSVVATLVLGLLRFY